MEEGANQEEARQDQGAFLCTACGFASKVLPLFDIKGKLKPKKNEKRIGKRTCSTTTQENALEQSGTHALQCSSSFCFHRFRGQCMEDIVVTGSARAV